MAFLIITGNSSFSYIILYEPRMNWQQRYKRQVEITRACYAHDAILTSDLITWSE